MEYIYPCGNGKYEVLIIDEDSLILQGEISLEQLETLYDVIEKELIERKGSL